MRTALSQGFTAPESYARGSGSWWGGKNTVWINLAYLAGGLWLLASGVIRWHIPVSILATLAACSLVDQWINGDAAPDVLFYLLSGATMLGAFFIATDPVSASTTVRGRLCYGAIIGALIFTIRRYGGYPDAIAFSVLLANLCVPLIDHYTRPRTFGHQGGR
jgi:Na+-translocating ferredoxin:NAD+ oxidoreductase subunit D